jgi:hypothetical protein
VYRTMYKVSTCSFMGGTAVSGCCPLIVITGRCRAVEYQSGILLANHGFYYSINFTDDVQRKEFWSFCVQSENVALCQCATLPQHGVYGAWK